MKISQFLQDLKAIWYFDNRFSLLFEKTFFRNSEGALHIYRKNGMEILMDKAAGDQSGARYAITSSMYKQYLPYIMSVLSSKPLNILDLGANVGGFALLLTLENIAIQTLVAVELNPNTFLRLRLNLERNLTIDRKNLHCINAGVCGEKRTLQITLGNGGMDDNIFDIHRSPIVNAQQYSIIGITFDAIIEDYYKTPDNQDPVIDICKMDIEGAEYEAILGQHSTRLHRCKFLIIEIHPHQNHSMDKLITAITQRGFQEIRTGTNVTEDVFLFCNTYLT